VNVSFTSTSTSATATSNSNVQQRDNNLFENRRVNIFDDTASNIIDQGYLKFNKLLKLCIYTTLLIIFSIFGLLALDITLSIETLDDSSIIGRHNHSNHFQNDTSPNN
jgi:hypothetical protein